MKPALAGAPLIQALESFGTATGGGCGCWAETGPKLSATNIEMAIILNTGDILTRWGALLLFRARSVMLVKALVQLAKAAQCRCAHP